jgi:hypothetical protein
MKFIYTIFLTCGFFVCSNSSNAQHSTFSLGVKGSIGFSVPDPSSSADIQGQSYSLRTNASYKLGMAAQYILGDVIGIETAILNTTVSFSKKDGTTASLQQSLGWNENISINSYQIPFQLMYLIRLRTHPNMRIKLTGGIAMDWLMARIAYKQRNPLFVPSLLCGARIKSRTGRFGHIEYGLEYQYSLNGNYDLTLQSYLGTGTVHSKYSTLSFTLYYFFLNRERTNQ